MKQKANEIRNWVQTALGEMSEELVQEWKKSGITIDDEMTKLINKWNKNGIRDLSGKLADYQYNDSDVLVSLLGDKIYDYGSSKTERFQIIDELQKLERFDAWYEALNQLRNDFESI